MDIGFFSAHGFEKKVFDNILKENNNSEISIKYFDIRLNEDTCSIARGYPVISAFVSDSITKEVVQDLSSHGLRLIALRSAGYNNVDLDACRENDISVVRVPAYSPYAVAEHALCLILALNRKIHRAYFRVKELNFSLDGLVGFDLHGKTVGVIGTGKIGLAFMNAISGLGVKILAYDPEHSPEVKDIPNASYVSFDELIRESKVISLHCPLNHNTFHLIGQAEIEKMKEGVYLINTGRGGLIDSKALIEGLKSGKIGGAGLDVYEEEEGVFFYDLSEGILKDDILARLLTFPNVLITAHQAFLTQEALNNIAQNTLNSIIEFNCGKELSNKID